MGLIDRFRGKRTSERVWAGMFGKHPAWDDHVHTSGIETEALIELRTTLYTQGIGGRIDSGVWDRLGSAERLGGFGHTLVWRSEQGLIAARLIASEDGKGRARYPLILCAHGRGLPLAWVCGRVVDRITEAAASCRAATTQADAIAEIDRARDELRSESESVGGAVEWCDGDAAAVVIESRGGRETLDRVVYCAKRDMRSHVIESLNEERRGSRSRAIDASARHVRVGAYAESGGEACSQWVRVMDQIVGEGTDLMAIAPDGAGFVDVLVGRPEADQFYCLMAGETALPVVGDVPYEVDEATRSWVSDLLAEQRAGRRRDRDPGFSGR